MNKTELESRIRSRLDSFRSACTRQSKQRAAKNRKTVQSIRIIEKELLLAEQIVQWEGWEHTAILSTDEACETARSVAMTAFYFGLDYDPLVELLFKGCSRDLIFRARMFLTRLEVRISSVE
jgi:hypothetical protein